jgi:hypothetical protein
MSLKNEDFGNEDYWKAIVLYGLNQATYKIALASVILDFAKEERQTIPWDDLSRAFLDKYIQRIQKTNLPQQSNPQRNTKMETIVSLLNLGKINYDEAIQEVSREAFNDVIPRFHSIGRDTELAKNRFYAFEMGKKIEISPFAKILSFNFENECRDEIASRWALLEGAFHLTRGDAKLENDIREIYLKGAYKRTPLTENIQFLRAYQGDVCFYCGESLNYDTIAVDHVLPRQVLMHDEIWNLVLSHGTCNSGKSDYLVGVHYIQKLIQRNENIMGSNHPWKSKIALALGNSPIERKKNLEIHYLNVKTVLRSNYWRGISGYNAEEDSFYRRLITKLNNR